MSHVENTRLNILNQYNKNVKFKRDKKLFFNKRLFG